MASQTRTGFDRIERVDVDDRVSRGEFPLDRFFQTVGDLVGLHQGPIGGYDDVDVDVMHATDMTGA